MIFANTLRERFAQLRLSGQVTAGTLEIVGESFIADEPSIFGKPNNDYIERELQWYLSGSLNVNDIPGGTPAIWKRVATPAGEINSNYGFLLLDEANGSQLENVVRALVDDPQTRRATAVYTRPSIHTDWNRGGMSDFICTNAVQYLIRGGQLVLVVQMRSNDVVFGYRNDYAWHRWTQEQVIKDLAEHDVFVEPGQVIWNAASLHIYERHFWILDHFLESGDPFPEVTK